MTKIKVTCGKCGGTGFLSHYRAISAGTCFPCNGKGYILTTQKAIDQKEKRKMEKKKKAEKIREYNEKKMTAFLLQFEADSDFLNRMKGMNPEEEGYQLAFDIMRLYESRGKFTFESIQ